MTAKQSIHSLPADVAQAGAGQAGETGEAETGADRVRRVLLQPLQGLRPARRVPRGPGQPAELTQAEMAAALDGLARDLSHLTERDLRGLLAVVAAQSQTHGALEIRRWPGPGQVLAWGLSLAPSPGLARDHLASVLSSRCGSEALARQAEVALLRRHRRPCPPPKSHYEWLVLVREQEDWQRRRTRIEAKEALWGADGLNDDDRAFAARFDADRAEALQLITMGQAKRGEA